jgi:hypothetical protein
MARAPYSKAAIREIVGSNLGMDRVDVELDTRHFDRGLDAALKLLERNLPQHGYQVIAIQPGGQKYPITVKNVIGVLGAEFFNGGLRLEEAPYYTRWFDRSLELADMHDTQRVFNDEPEWTTQTEVDPTTNEERLMFYVVTTRSSFVDVFWRLPTFVCVKVTWGIESSDDLQVGVSRIPRDLRQWVEDYTTARCRIVMGDVRGKFAGVPGSDSGSVLPTDGTAQVQRGERDAARLEKDLVQRVRQLPITYS